MSEPFDIIDETTAEDGTPFRVVIERDDDSANLEPRGLGSEAGRIVALDTRDCWRPREDAAAETYPQAWRANAASIVDAVQDHAFQTVARWLRIFHGATVVLPLYEGTDGLTTGDENDTAGPDEYRGVTFDTPETRKAVGYPHDANTPQRRAEVMGAMLASDVAVWAEWARGDVFGYIVQRGTVDEDGEIEWDENSNEDACWGHIGEDWAREAARVALDDFVSHYDTDHPAGDEPGDDEDAEAQRAELGAVVVGGAL